MTEAKVTYAKPDYDESRSVAYDITYRNWIGIKIPRLLTISYQKLAIIISEHDNNKTVVHLPASLIKMAIPSEHVDTQVTIVTPTAKKGAYKVWLADGERNKVKPLIRDINKLVELYRDVLEEQGAAKK